MYEIYTTDAFILPVIPQGEADHYVKLYTKELGLVGAKAISSQKEKSKHRYSIQPYSFVSVSLVKGKTGFRVTGLEHQKHMVLGMSESVKKTVGYASLLIQTLVHGQEQDGVFFNMLHELISELPKYVAEDEYEKEGNPYEIYVIVRLLDHLGYFQKNFLPDMDDDFFDTVLPNNNDLEYIAENKTKFIGYINQCIASTQL